MLPSGSSAETVRVNCAFETITADDASTTRCVAGDEVTKKGLVVVPWIFEAPALSGGEQAFTDLKPENVAMSLTAFTVNFPPRGSPSASAIVTASWNDVSTVPSESTTLTTRPNGAPAGADAGGCVVMTSRVAIAGAVT